MPYTQVHESDSGGWVWQHDLHGEDELQENLEAARILANHGYKIELLPTIEELNTQLRAELLPDVYNNKNPDVRINSVMIGDIKTPVLATKSSINRAIYRSGQQKAEVAIINLDSKAYTIRDVKTGIVGALQPDRNSSIQQVWIITRTKNLFIVTRQNVYDDSIYEVLDSL